MLLYAAIGWTTVLIILQSAKSTLLRSPLESFPSIADRRTDVMWHLQSLNSLGVNSPDEFQEFRASVLNRELDNSIKPASNPVRACYFTNWAQYRKGKGRYVPEKYKSGLCTHIFYAFAWMNNDLTIRAFDPADESRFGRKGMYEQVMDLKQGQPGLKVMLSLGGWSFGSRLFKQMAATSETRKIFIDSVIPFLRDRNFDGFDIDWEYPVGESRTLFVELLKDLKQRFAAEAELSGKPQLTLTAAVSAGKRTIDQAYDVPELSRILDFVMVMTYDFHGAWEDKTGFNSPLHSRRAEPASDSLWNVQWATNYWVDRGMPRQKIVVGLPTYGRGWTLLNNNRHELGSATSGPSKATTYVMKPGIAAYYEICDLLYQDDTTRHWDDESKVPFLVSGDQWISYEDQQSIRYKAQWIKKNGFAGAMVWSLAFDDFDGNCPQFSGIKYPLLSVVEEELKSSDGKIDAGSAKFVTISPPEVVPQTPKSPVTRPDKPIAPSANFCTGKPNGQFADYTDCRRYIQCEDFRPSYHTCLPDSGFSHRQQACVDLPASDCNESNRETILPGTETENTETEIEIDENEVNTESEKTGNEDGEEQGGEVAPNDGRGQRKKPTNHYIRSKLVSVQEVPGPDYKCPESNGFFRQDCSTRFIRCVSGVPHTFYCPYNLVLNPEKKSCDWKYNVDEC